MWSEVFDRVCGCAGELRPDEGDALVAGHSVVSQLSAARQQLGYCPQVLIPFLCVSKSLFSFLSHLSSLLQYAHELEKSDLCSCSAQIGVCVWNPVTSCFGMKGNSSDD